MNFASFSVAASNDSVTWVTVVVAVAAGAVGSLLTAVLALSGRLLRIRREIEANNRAIRNIDRHLETWVSDATVDLVRELDRIRNQLNERGLFRSGAYGVEIGRAKERVLHAYRDQENTARAQADEIRAREGRTHGLVRAWRFRSDDLELRTPDRVLPVLERWATPPTQHLSPTDEPQPLDSDPRNRTVETTLAYLDAKPNALN